ncbi:e9imm peptide [Streptomyces sp. NPDC056656]|uniref:e9imm peptide n=1 Tax=Streptomyces TaxID=1883 RepID=UPI0036B2AEB8
MATPRSMDREEALSLVRRLMAADFINEDEADEAMAKLERGLVCPHISDYIYWDFDPELTAEKIINRALAYEPFAL